MTNSEKVLRLLSRLLDAAPLYPARDLAMGAASLLVASVISLVPVAPVSADDSAEVRAMMEQKIAEVYSQPGTREITEACRSKSENDFPDIDAVESYIIQNYADESQVLACLAGYHLYLNNKTGAWNNSDVVDCFMKLAGAEEYREYQEKANCSALMADIRNYKTYLEAYFADHMEYPKTADFSIDLGSDTKNAFSYLAEGTAIDYKPSNKYQKYAVTARSEKCPKTYWTSSDSSEVKIAKKKGGKKRPLKGQ